jgi:hypothetical protein
MLKLHDAVSMPKLCADLCTSMNIFILFLLFSTHIFPRAFRKAFAVNTAFNFTISSAEQTFCHVLVFLILNLKYVSEKYHLNLNNPGNQGN